ncbi:hypothetical protein SCHPADRAFT_873568 [Schizopora paradoxa]|uniref:Uncharacterized protein n=1 Tax=Schizopora paradoxa TaxID=27342 RepID=A0A0H2RPM6_9AGAM|nr:hypothetical protein SCHPADRAFT_873568 [Schizopora paradoxa]
MSIPPEAHNNLGLENVPDLQVVGIGLRPATPLSHDYELNHDPLSTSSGSNSLGLHEMYDLEASPISEEERDLGEGNSTGYERENWTPNMPPVEAYTPIPLRISRSNQFSRSSSLRKLVHVMNPSSSNISTRVNCSPNIPSSGFAEAVLGNKHVSDPFQTHDPHIPRRNRRTPSTIGRDDETPRNYRALSLIYNEALVEVYRHLLFRLPTMYHSRVTQLIYDAEVSKPEMELLFQTLSKGVSYSEDWSPSSETPALKKFKHNWDVFITQVMQEWKTLNVVSALLLSAILTMFQIDGAATQPLIHTASLLSLMCAIWSLIYGCAYILRFASLKGIYRASRWAQEAHDSEEYILWNVWVLLALPAVWLAWSVIAFLIAIMAYVWTSGSSPSASMLQLKEAAWIPRVIVTAFFVLGLLCFVLVVRTFSNYGTLHASNQRPEDSNAAAEENTGDHLTASPGRRIASPRTIAISPEVLFTPDGKGKNSNLSPSPRTPDLLLMSPRSLERRDLE